MFFKFNHRERPAKEFLWHFGDAYIATERTVGNNLIIAVFVLSMRF
jgi:hypothetical protein